MALHLGQMNSLIISPNRMRKRGSLTRLIKLYGTEALKLLMNTRTEL